jgi:hypothetical protein
MAQLERGRQISEWLAGDVFDKRPATWQELQDYVAQLFRELGWTDVESPHKLKGVRITKEVDVFGVDRSVKPPLAVVCECKY